MVFVVGSSDQTTKVILNSRTRTSGESNNPKFTLFQPIITPYDSIGLVNLEGCIVSAPSLFSSGVLDNPRNWFFNNAQPFVNNFANVSFVLNLFKTLNMNSPDMTALFLINFVNVLSDCYFELPLYMTPTGICSILYYDAAAQRYYTGMTIANAQQNPALTGVQILPYISEYVKNFHTCTFTIRSKQAGDIFCFSGEWTKVLGLTPKYRDNDADFYAIANDRPLRCTLNTTGYRYLNLHTNFARAVYTSNDDYVISPSDVLWCVPIRSDPGETTYYDNVNTAGKIPYNTNIIESIEVYFTDEWGDWVTDIEEFTASITFDFSPKQEMSNPPTIKQARRNLAENAGL